MVSIIATVWGSPFWEALKQKLNFLFIFTNRSLLSLSLSHTNTHTQTHSLRHTYTHTLAHSQTQKIEDIIKCSALIFRIQRKQPNRTNHLLDENF